MFSWQTILCLRILNELQARFGVEVIAWRNAIARCQELFRECAFPTLWGASVSFPSTNEAILLWGSEKTTINAYVLISLDPHLRALAVDDSAQPDLQLPLFAAISVRK